MHLKLPPDWAWKHDSLLIYLELVHHYSEIPGDPKKYSCLIKRKMHNQRGIFKIETFLNHQWANLNLDMLDLIFSSHLAEIWMVKVR